APGSLLDEPFRRLVGLLVEGRLEAYVQNALRCPSARCQLARGPAAGPRERPDQPVRGRKDDRVVAPTRHQRVLACGYLPREVAGKGVDPIGARAAPPVDRLVRV